MSEPALIDYSRRLSLAIPELEFNGVSHARGSVG